MGFNWQGIIVRATDLDGIRELEPRAIALPGGFVRVAWDNFDWTDVGSTVPWSTKFGEAWMLCAASTSSVFAYEHAGLANRYDVGRGRGPESDGQR